MNKVIITQSNYIPWKGYFRPMKEATHFVVYDDMQYTKRDWRNRNLLISPIGPKWLSIPIDVKGKFYQKINEAKVSDKNWNIDHWNFIETNYKKSPYYNLYKDEFKGLYLSEKSEFLSEININFIKKIIELLNIDITILDSRNFELKGDRTEKLLNICLELKAKEYFTGEAAKNYINENVFIENNVKITYNDHSSYPEYKQLWYSFDHHVSIIDMFFNLGEKTGEFI